LIPPHPLCQLLDLFWHSLYVVSDHVKLNRESSAIANSFCHSLNLFLAILSILWLECKSYQTLVPWYMSLDYMSDAFVTSAWFSWWMLVLILNWGRGGHWVPLNCFYYWIEINPLPILDPLFMAQSRPVRSGSMLPHYFFLHGCVDDTKLGSAYHPIWMCSYIVVNIETFVIYPAPDLLMIQVIIFHFFWIGTVSKPSLHTSNWSLHMITSVQNEHHFFQIGWLHLLKCLQLTDAPYLFINLGESISQLMECRLFWWWDKKSG